MNDRTILRKNRRRTVAVSCPTVDGVGTVLIRCLDGVGTVLVLTISVLEVYLCTNTHITRWLCGVFNTF